MLSNGLTQWDDVVTTATNTRINPTTTRPAFDYDSLTLNFIRDPDSSDVAYYQVQMPHGVVYSNGTNPMCSPHFHYLSYAPADTTFNIVLWYRICNIGQPCTDWEYLTLVSRAKLSVPTWGHQIAEFQEIELDHVYESSFILYKLYRKDNAGNPATLRMLGFDTHFEFDKLGTPEEYPSH